MLKFVYPLYWVILRRVQYHGLYSVEDNRRVYEMLQTFLLKSRSFAALQTKLVVPREIRDT
jgi:hypothetical protein